MIVVEYIKLRDHVRLDEANVVFSKASISLEDCIDVCTRYRVSTYFRLALVRLSKTVGYGGLIFTLRTLRSTGQSDKEIRAD